MAIISVWPSKPLQFDEIPAILYYVWAELEDHDHSYETVASTAVPETTVPETTVPETETEPSTEDGRKTFTCANDSSHTYTAVFTRTGWLTTGEGTQYLVKDEAQKTGWTEIADSWYYLNPETGCSAEGITRVPYPETEIDGSTYSPDQESMDYAAGKGLDFIDETEAWFWFNTDGKFLSSNTGMVPGACFSPLRWRWGCAPFIGSC